MSRLVSSMRLGANNPVIERKVLPVQVECRGDFGRQVRLIKRQRTSEYATQMFFDRSIAQR